MTRPRAARTTTPATPRKAPSRAPKATPAPSPRPDQERPGQVQERLIPAAFAEDLSRQLADKCIELAGVRTDAARLSGQVAGLLERVGRLEAALTAAGVEHPVV